MRSSWSEYQGKSKINICNKDIILGQFNSTPQYKKSALESLKHTMENRYGEEALAMDLLSKEESPMMFVKKKLST